ncbi:hypothetical protein [Aequorivita echinoideorum]|uniref:CAAX protease self-immunity n=1 Tax=Aequorivita echinoideorum TaxID=1549647 RepID=A0ABS5S0V4_9FLAO|nr:hypothetical protein [Aequorivita echinoideorum]MBT0606819.1 hypothetical protein [Aequorivita echinoideorum]
MKNINPTLNAIAHHYKRWDLLLFTFLTSLAVVFGQTTIFYIIYFFWWNELIRIFATIFRTLKDKNQSQNKTSVEIFGPLFMMGIYFVFIVVFFGFIANWGNEELTMVNLGILFFQNWFFNINLMIVALEEFFLFDKALNNSVIGPFTPSMLVLHISIILGGILMFFVVKTFPDSFGPQNLWGSLLIISPFLLLKFLMHRFLQSIT